MLYGEAPPPSYTVIYILKLKISKNCFSSFFFKTIKAKTFINIKNKIWRISSPLVSDGEGVCTAPLVCKGGGLLKSRASHPFTCMITSSVDNIYHTSSLFPCDKDIYVFFIQ